MTWNYCLLDHGTHLAVHEVHYDKRGKVRAWTAQPTTFVGDIEEGAEGMQLQLARALADAVRLPVLDARKEEARILLDPTPKPV